MATEIYNGINTFYAKSRRQWRNWLQKNHAKEKSVWLIIYRKETKLPSVYYKEAVEEALCFGWIDSKPNKRDDKSYYQFFAKRNPKSKWSRINKDKVDELISKGLMTAAGMEAIETAKQNGVWNALDDVESFVMPEALQKALSKNKTALKNFEAFPPGSRKIIIQWVTDAKREETKQKRIEETVTLAAKNIRANHYRNS